MLLSSPGRRRLTRWEAGPIHNASPARLEGPPGAGKPQARAANSPMPVARSAARLGEARKMSASITSERAARQPVPPRRSVASLRAAPAPSASLNRLSVHWQVALTAAQDAVHAAA